MSVDALSLACNIITVIDFGHKFYGTVRNVYDKGASDPTTGYKANELAALAERLKTSRNQALHSLPNNDQLFVVADKCVKAAEDLQNEIRRLVPSNSSSRTTKALRSLLSASKRTWRHNRIEQLSKSLDECQATMQTSVLLHMYQSGEADKAMRLDEFSKLDSRLQSFIHAVSKQDLQISQLLAENRLLHQETQAVFRQEVVAWRDAQISDGQLTQSKASLRFPEMNQRYNELRAAHETSFKWLLGDSKAVHQSAPQDSNFEEEPYYIQELRNETFGDFKQWLISEADSKLYWVSGKPGAGKSTLMKYLSRRMENKNLVEGPHLVIRHFFWLGTSHASSRLNDMQGMFLTLLHQVLGHEVFGESLAATLLVQNPQLRQKHTATDWSLEELEAITQQTLKIISRQYLVFILVDALDEHLPASEHGELLDVFQRFEKIPNVRLILSSRHERIFDARLARSRQLRLQDLTGPDIYHFSLGSLLKNVYFQEGPSSESAKQIAMGIARKAEGVFLWARLAVDSLKRGYIDGNSENEIRSRLNDIPTELSDFFKSIWTRLGDDQKRYQVSAANIFSLLTCEANDYNPGLHDCITDFDLLSASLALNPDVACALIHGDTHIEETCLLKLCQETERQILSHCAGLLEFEHSQELPNCHDLAPTNIDLNISAKKFHFVHRTAREFFQGTPEGKRLIDFNDMVNDGPSFRFALGSLARLAAFRDLRNTFHRCSLPGRFFMRTLFNFLGHLEYASAISTDQLHTLIAVCHKLYFRFSGHPDNPIFENWVIIQRTYRVFPFIATAAMSGQGSYALKYMEMQARSGRIFPLEAYGMILKMSLESCLDYGMTRLLHSEEGGSRLRSLETLIHHFHACHFPSTLYFGRLAGARANHNDRAYLPASHGDRTYFPLCHLVLNLLFYIVDADENTWDISTSSTDSILNAALNLAKLLSTSDSGLFQSTFCTFSTNGEGWSLRNLPFKEQTDDFLPTRLYRMSVVFEVSPILLFGHVARVAARVRGLEKFSNGLMELIHLQGQNSREVQKPRPVLLLDYEWSGAPWKKETCFCWNGAKEILDETQDELSEMLVGFLDEDSGARFDSLIQRLQKLWGDNSMNWLRAVEVEELFISYGLRCSKEEGQKILKACNILVADDYASVDRDDSGRFMKPPVGCSEEEERMSHYLLDETYE